jgi:hypothetical protein
MTSRTSGVIHGWSVMNWARALMKPSVSTFALWIAILKRVVSFGISLTGPGPVIAVMYALRAAIAEVTLAFCVGCILAGERLLVGLLG